MKALMVAAIILIPDSNLSSTSLMGFVSTLVVKKLDLEIPYELGLAEPTRACVSNFYGTFRLGPFRRRYIQT